MTVLSGLDAAGRRRSPATMPGYHAGRQPRNRGSGSATWRFRSALAKRAPVWRRSIRSWLVQSGHPANPIVTLASRALEALARPPY